MATATNATTKLTFPVPAIEEVAIATATTTVSNIIAIAISLVATIFAIIVKPYLERYMKHQATLLMRQLYLIIELTLRVAMKCLQLTWLIRLLIEVVI